MAEPGQNAEATEDDPQAPQSDAAPETGAELETGDEDEEGLEAAGEVTEGLRSALEALLFAHGDPVSPARLAKVLPGVERATIRKGLDELATAYEEGRRGIRLVKVAGGYQLRTAAEHRDAVHALLEQKPVRITRASLETLAIVAYRQPVTRAEIEAIRGVDAGGALNTLAERKLVRVVGRKDVVGRPLLYATTPEFLEIFGLASLKDLPTLEELGASADALERALAGVGEVDLTEHEGTAERPEEP